MVEDSDKTAILVVEDEEAIRRGLCDVLTYHGYAPTGVDNGEDGLREALTNRFALVILDLMLLASGGGAESQRGEQQQAGREPGVFAHAVGARVQRAGRVWLE